MVKSGVCGGWCEKLLILGELINVILSFLDTTSLRVRPQEPTRSSRHFGTCDIRLDTYQLQVPTCVSLTQIDIQSSLIVSRGTRVSESSSFILTNDGWYLVNFILLKSTQVYRLLLNIEVCRDNLVTLHTCNIGPDRKTFTFTLVQWDPFWEGTKGGREVRDEKWDRVSGVLM